MRIWLIAAIEGFSTLAVEVIVIRLAIPVVGSSVTLTGIVLGVVLLALSAGYWRGGALSARWDKAQIRRALARNLFSAAALYGAVAFPWEAALLEKLLDADLPLSAAIGAMAVLLFVFPIYLASQTVPLLAELINTEGKAGKASGKVLFYSTVGSVAGGIVTPVWLFPSIGVARSTYIVCGLLAAIAAALAIGQFRTIKLAGIGAVALASALTAGALALPGNSLYSFDSAYQSIRIIQAKAENGRMMRVLDMSGSRSSAIYADDGATAFEYVLAAERAFDEVNPRRALVIGAAGFTFPRDIAGRPSIEQVDAVDVDPVVKPIAEREFLKQPLPPKVRFLPLSARYAVRRLAKNNMRYGFTFVDAYFGKGIPDELVTVEFFRDVRMVSAHTAANVVLDRAMQSAFARNTLASFRASFGDAWVRDVRPGDDDLTNILVTSWPVQGSAQWNGSGEIYHDDRNSADRDHVEMVW